MQENSAPLQNANVLVLQDCIILTMYHAVRAQSALDSKLSLQQQYMHNSYTASLTKAVKAVGTHVPRKASKMQTTSAAAQEARLLNASDSTHGEYHAAKQQKNRALQLTPADTVEPAQALPGKPTQAGTAAEAADPSSSEAGPESGLGRGRRRSKAPARHQDWAQIDAKRRRRRVGPPAASAALTAPGLKTGGADGPDADASTETTTVVFAADSLSMAMPVGSGSPQSAATCHPPVKRMRARKRPPVRASD